MSHRAPRLLSQGVLFGALVGLSGCNLIAASLFGDEVSPPPVFGTRVEVSVRPVPALFDAAARAPQALEKLRELAPGGRFADFLSPEQRAMLRGELLSDGLILPIPLGSVTIRTIGPTRPPVEAIEARSLAELVGAYTAGERLLILDTDGNFVLAGDRGEQARGSFGGLRGGFWLKSTDGKVQHWKESPGAAPGSFTDEQGAVFSSLHAPTSPADRPQRGERDEDSLEGDGR